MGVFSSVSSRVAFLGLIVAGALMLSVPAATASTYGDRIDAAREFVASSGMERGLQRQITSIVSRVTEQLKREYPGVDARKIEEISNTVLSEFQQRIPELLDDAARVYAEHFTKTELKEMTRYNRSAVGRKQQEKQSVVAQQMGDAFNLWLTRVSYNASKRMEELLNQSSGSSGYGY